MPEVRLEVEHACDLAIDWHRPLPIQTPTGLRLTYFFKGGTLTGAMASVASAVTVVSASLANSW